MWLYLKPKIRKVGQLSGSQGAYQIKYKTLYIALLLNLRSRKSNFQSLDTVFYTLNISTSQGNLTIPRLGGDIGLTLNNYDSKVGYLVYFGRFMLMSNPDTSV